MQLGDSVTTFVSEVHVKVIHTGERILTPNRHFI